MYHPKMANQLMTVYQIGRYIVSLEETEVCVFDPITQNNIYLPLSDTKTICDGLEDDLIPWFETKFSRKRSFQDSDNHPSSRRCR